MAWLASGMALATMAARVMALPALVMVSLAPALLLLPLPALVLAGTRVRRLEQLKTRRTRRRDEASGLVRGQQLSHLQGAAAAADA